MVATLSQRYLDTMQHGYTMISTAELYRGGSRLVTASPLKIGGGEITGNATDPIRRRMSCEFVDANRELIPTMTTDPMMPNGVDVLIKSGPLWEDGTSELQPVGLFRITETSSDDFGKISISGFDLGITLQTPLTQPYFIPGGTEVGQAVSQLIAAKNPAINLIAFNTGRVTQPTLIDFGADPLQEARKVAYAAACDIEFDTSGNCVFAPIVSEPGPSEASFVEGETDGLRFWDTERRVSSDGVPSVVVVEGNNSGQGAAIRVIVKDNDPTSPTYAAGPYGEVVKTITSEKITDQEQCSVLGLTELRRSSWAERFSFSCLPNPALGQNSSIDVSRSRMKLGKQKCVIHSFTLPLTVDSGDMSIEAATRISLDFSMLEG